MSESTLTGIELERKAKEAIRGILARIPGASVEDSDAPPGRRGDFQVRFRTAAGLRTLHCEAKSRAWPNELHAVAHRLKSALEGNRSGLTIPVFVAPYVSKQAAEACLNLGISWADLAGNCELRIDGAYVKITGEPNPFQKGRGTVSLYSPKSANIIHALLLDAKRSWTTEELAQTAHVSLGQVASVKKLLETNGWIQSSYGKTELVAPEELLDDWSQNYKPKRKTHQFFTLDSPSELESKVANTMDEYAFTEFSAGERYASYTRHQRVAFYVTQWEDNWGRTFRFKPGEGASNVTVYEQSEPLLFVETFGDACCASPIQTYLDLKALPGRGQDAAANLRETVLQPRWR